VAFLSLRKHGAFLVWALTSSAAQLGIPTAQVRHYCEVRDINIAER
jgi:hypothetical protein